MRKHDCKASQKTQSASMPRNSNPNNSEVVVVNVSNSNSHSHSRSAKSAVTLTSGNKYKPKLDAEFQYNMNNFCTAYSTSNNIASSHCHTMPLSGSSTVLLKQQTTFHCPPGPLNINCNSSGTPAQMYMHPDRFALIHRDSGDNASTPTTLLADSLITSTSTNLKRTSTQQVESQILSINPSSSRNQLNLINNLNYLIIHDVSNLAIESQAQHKIAKFSTVTSKST